MQSSNTFSRCRLCPLTRPRSLWLGAAIAASVSALSPGAASIARAEVVWRGDFETEDFSQWDFELRPEGLSIVNEPVADGMFALRVELSSATVWDNGIFRTELQHQPETSRVSEGAELYFGWSVYLPEPLPTGEDQDYQLGYFETTGTNNQVFSLHAIGDGLILSLNHDPQDNGWIERGTVKTGQWHRIVYHVKWSSDPGQGFVSMWLDGVKLVDEAHARTFIDNQPAFIQLGLLKNPPAPPQSVVLYVDAAMEGDSYEDVALGIAENDGATTPPEEPSVDPVQPAPEDSTEDAASTQDDTSDTTGSGEASGESTGADPQPSAAPGSSSAPNTPPAPTEAPVGVNPPTPGTSLPNVPSAAPVNPSAEPPVTPPVTPPSTPSGSPSNVATAMPPGAAPTAGAGMGSTDEGGGCTIGNTRTTSIWPSLLGLGLAIATGARRRNRSRTLA